MPQVFARLRKHTKNGTEQLKRENRTPYCPIVIWIFKHGITQFHTIPGNYAHGLSSTPAEQSNTKNSQNDVHQQ